MATAEGKEEDNDLIDKRLCGIGKFRPKVLQKCATIQAFIGVYSINSMFTSMLVSYLGSQIPSIEKQFSLPSSYSGLLTIFNDIGYLAVVLIVTPLAKHVHIPRWLFGCFVLYGISGILCGLPHFFSMASGHFPSLTLDPKMNNSANKAFQYPLCTGNKSESDDCESGSKSVSVGITDPGIRKMFLGLFGIGMIFQGAAKTIRGPFVTVYVDDEGKKKNTGFYIGLVVGVTLLGPVMSYILGGLFSRMYVTLEDVDIGPRDPRWIGAWWFGFVVFGALAMVVSVPLAFFPRHLKPPAKIQEETPVSTSEIVKDRVLSFWRIFKSPVYPFLALALIAHYASLVGFYVFISKYMSTQYNVTLWKANIIIAGANIASIGIGSVGGGIITKKMKLTPRRLLGLILALKAVHTLMFAMGLILGCEQPSVVGPERFHGQQPPINTTCYGSCGCDERDYFPVCGSDGISYHSPCYAGCDVALNKGNSYRNCTCVPDGKATVGLCETNCKTLWPFAVTSFISGLLTAFTISPGFIAQIRSVEDRDKSTAIGVTSFLSSIIAFLPCPIIVGKMVDNTCLIWQKTCSSAGACLFYNIVDFRVHTHVFSLSFKILALVFYSIAIWKVRKLKEWPHAVKEKTEVEVSFLPEKSGKGNNEVGDGKENDEN